MKKLIIRILYIGFVIGVLGALGGVSLLLSVSMDLPKIETLADYHPPVTTEIYSSDGELLLETYKEKRYLVNMEDIPDRIVSAFLSAEDDKFFEHSGVDYLGIMRAMIANIKEGRVVQGGSTITQQVAKSLLLTSERSIVRKIKDFLLAQKIEKRFSKKDILYLYLNQVYLGGGYYGVKAAFKGYFGKELTEATVAEAALIAGLLVAPGRYSPYLKPSRAKSRQKYVLGRMFANKKITKAEYEAALKEDIRIERRQSQVIKAGYFTDWIRQKVIEEVGEGSFYTNGFKIKTTLNWKLQQAAEREVMKGVEELDKRQGFKGPIREINLSQELEKFEIDFRKKVVDEKIQFYTFTTQGKLEAELNFDKEEFEEMKSSISMLSEDYKNRHFVPGTHLKDSFANLLEVGKKYEAVVINVNRQQRAVYVSLGGARGVIPYENFRWAHERKIDTDKKYFSYVLNPNSILKPGDVILIRITRPLRSPYSYLYSTFRENVKDKELIKNIKKQKFFICSLEQYPEAQGALFSISPKSGHVLSLVGGYSFKDSQFNRAIQSMRQPGSSVKPFIYATALEHGYTPSSRLIDSPAALSGVGDGLNWKPRNYDGEFKGALTLRRSLEISRNVPTIKLMQDLGIEKVANMIGRVGLDSGLVEDLSFSLGSFGVTLYNMVLGYSIFPNGGKKVELKSILEVEDRFGRKYDIHAFDTKTKDVNEQVAESEETVASEENKSIEPQSQIEAKSELAKEQEVENPFISHLDEKQVYDKRLSYIMTNLLRGVIQSGTGVKAKGLSKFVGGKTGTTNNYVDAWFIGFSSNVVTGVWTGMDDNTTMGWPEGGSKAALPIWIGYMRDSLAEMGEYDFRIPSGIVNVQIDKSTGQLSSGMTNSFVESFVVGTEPGTDNQEFKEAFKSENTGLGDEDDFFSNQ